MIPLWRGLLAVTGIAVTTLAFLPDYSHLPSLVTLSDLLNHAAAFATLYVLACFSYPRSHPLRIAALLLLYGIWIEAVQAFLPTRSASLSDIAADTAGMVLGYGIAKGAEALLRRRSMEG